MNVLMANTGGLYDILEEGEHRNTSSSYSSLLSTLLPLLVLSIPLLCIFLYLRVRLRRVYAPRTFLDVLHDEEKTPKLEKVGYFNWMPEFWKRPDKELLDHQNLDGYLFVRFMKMISLMSFIGACLTLPLLILNHMGGGGAKELESLTLSNIEDPMQYYWHCLIACILFAIVMFLITKETIYYINLRYAFLLTPRIANLVSSRTVLFTSVTKDWRDEEWLRADFDKAERVFLATDCSELESLINKRDVAVREIEHAELDLLKTAIEGRNMGELQHNQQSGLLTSRYVAENQRPKKRSFPVFGSLKDVIQSQKDTLQRLNRDIEKEQMNHLQRRATKLPSVFIQFTSQRVAQQAFQEESKYLPGEMEARSIGTLPEEVIFQNLSIPRWSRLCRQFVANVLIVLLIIFWSIPTGLVTALADLDTLTDQIPFLQFINKIPVPILGVVTGLLPAILISTLLALVPIICRYLATKAGAVTLAQVELTSQGWYFAFQAVQVFLVTTFSSGASAIAKDIYDDPAVAPSLLAENLPSASNFYLSYFMLQGITVAATEIFQFLPLLFALTGSYIDVTPRQKFERWSTLSGIAWGDTYPKLTNLLVIALAYSCIAPLVLWFATIGLFILYLAYRYNIFYVMSTSVNTKGDAYGRALQHLTVGIYLAELSLIGLFAAGGGEGPAKVMVLFLIVTITYQIYMNWVLSPLLNSLSDTMLREDEEEALIDVEVTGQEDLRSLINENLDTVALKPAQSSITKHRNSGGIFAPYLFNNSSKSTYPSLRTYLRSTYLGTKLPPVTDLTLQKKADLAYLNVNITSKCPTIWIPRDDIGISKEQVIELEGAGLVASDRCAWIGKDGIVTWAEEDLKGIPIWEQRIDL